MKVDLGYSWCVVQNWRISLKNGNLFLRFEQLQHKINLFLPTELIEGLVLIIHCYSCIICQFISSLVPLCPLVGLRPPSKIRSFSHSASLSLLRLCLTLSLTQHQTSFSLNAGALSHWHTHYLNGYMGWCGCHEILIALWYFERKSFARIAKNVKSNSIFYLDDKRKAQICEANTNWMHEKNYPYEKKGVVPVTVDPLLSNYHFLVHFFDFLSTVLEISHCLYFSAPLCEGWLRLFLMRCSELENFTEKWQSLSQIWTVTAQNQSFLANWTDWGLSSHYSLLLLHNLSVHLFLGSTVPFGRPSASFENSFILSFCLTITTASLSDPVPNTTPDLVLSKCWCSLTLTHSLPQWVYGMVRVPRDLDCTLVLWKEVFCPYRKKCQVELNFLSGW